MFSVAFKYCFAFWCLLLLKFTFQGIKKKESQEMKLIYFLTPVSMITFKQNHLTT